MPRQWASRRTVLKSGVSASALGMTGLAGCMGSDTSGDEDAEDDSASDDDHDDNGDDGDEYTLSLGTSTEGSFTFEAGQAISRAVDQHSDWLSVSPQLTPGAAEGNLRLYEQGDIEAGGSDNVTYTQAALDKGPFEEDPVNSIPQQGFLYLLAHMYMVQPEGRGIEDMDDLAGKTVYMHPPGTAVRTINIGVFEEAGLRGEIEELGIARGDLVGAIKEGRIDAVVVYGNNYLSLPGWQQELDAQLDFELVPTTDRIIEATQNVHGAMNEEIEAYAWEANDHINGETVNSWAGHWQFMFGEDVPNEVTYEIARLVSEQNDTVREASEGYPDQTDPEMQAVSVTPDLPPVHGGIAQWYDENDVELPEGVETADY